MVKGQPWSKDEIDYLIKVYNVPNLEKHWRKQAKIAGWPARGDISLKGKIAYLLSKQVIKPKTDPSSGYLSLTQLAKYLGVNFKAVRRWTDQCGLPYTKDKDDAEQGTAYKVSMKEFTRWALNEGLNEVAKTCFSNRLALTWLLIQIREWGQVDE